MLAAWKTVRRIACFSVGLMVLLSNLSLASMPQYVPGQIIVQFTPEVGKITIQQREGLSSVGITSLDQKMEQYGVSGIRQIFPHKKSELALIYQFDFDPQYDAMEVARDFAGDEHLRYAEPRRIRQLCDAPNDLYFLQGWQWYLDRVRGPEAWDIAHGDSTVIIGIVDTGVDWDHPDLVDNIWFNSGEDANGDGVITAIDWNSVDDDGNGFVDDWHGWDFGGTAIADNNPNEDEPVHGTHVAGIAAAVTHNEVGVAGMSWNCTIMPVKISHTPYDGIHFGFEGIQYAIDNGADVINLSWGGTGFDPFEQMVIDSAFEKGVIVVASAGNDPPCSPPDTCPPHYPSGYNHVVSVAATNQSDRAASWTYYGSTVDVAAPGVSIWNTWWNDTYSFLQGTSMSSPVVAGVAGLLKSVDPDITSDEFEAKMWHTSDNIDHLNPAYVGWLGGGRVNAYRALLSVIEPLLAVDGETSVEDSGGNQDGRADPGETVDWIITLDNAPTWQLAQDVGVKVTTPDETITFQVDSTAFGDIPEGTSASNASNPFEFSVSDTAEAHWAMFYFQIAANSGAYMAIDSLEMMIGRPEILVVDDDGGDDVEEAYWRDLESLSVVFDTWNVAKSGKIGAVELAPYRVVIWLTGAQEQATLTADDRNSLAAFLDLGDRSLFLTGQNIGDEVGGEAFFSDYLHVSHVADTVFGFPVLEGVLGDTISGDTELLIVGAEPQNSPSAVQALAGAVDIYSYKDEPQGHVAATRFESPKGYKVVYFAFGFEGIRGTSGYSDSWFVLERILNWFDVQTEFTDVSESEETVEGLPRSYSLYQNYPNPFNAETVITYQLPNGVGPQLITLRIYNILGQEVRTLVREVQGVGTYRVRWDGRDQRGEEVSTAVYFYRLESGDFSLIKKMVLLK